MAPEAVAMTVDMATVEAEVASGEVPATDEVPATAEVTAATEVHAAAAGKTAAAAAEATGFGVGRGEHAEAGNGDSG